MNSSTTLRRRFTAVLLASALAGAVAVADEPHGAAPTAQHLHLVSLRSSIGFDFSVAQLDPAAELEVQALGAALASLPNARITISGYTDATGPGELNLQLSQSRADNVRLALEAAGVDPARITLEANGEWFSQRLPTDANAQARQRRVDIRVEQQL